MASRVDAWDDVAGARSENAGTNDMRIEPLIQERDTQAALSGRATVGVEDAVVEVDDLTRDFGKTQALDGVTLHLQPGEIHALLGPNGAGKTTLVRVLAGLVAPTSGRVRVAGQDPSRELGSLRRQVGLVPSGDRSFYLRISGLENLLFFARLNGQSRRAGVARAYEVLAQVGLEHAARERVGHYSHGMQKRLSVARALLTNPLLMLVDEATHDLDPEGAERVRGLVRERARDGTAVLWTTQRLDEIRGLADNVTLLNQGKVRFAGTVPDLLMQSPSNRFVLSLRSTVGSEDVDVAAQRAVGELGSLTRLGDEGSQHYILSLRDGSVLGRALSALTEGGLDVLSCHGERSEVEEAFLALLEESPE
jgi:ABC-2 type transport system ATP-binding protein